MAADATIRVWPDVHEWGSQDDDRWRSDLAELQLMLRRELPDAVAPPVPAGDAKGVAEIASIILALGSAGVFTAAADVIKAWIAARPGHRRVVVEYPTESGPQRLVVDADGIDGDKLADLAATALDQRQQS